MALTDRQKRRIEDLARVADEGLLAIAEMIFSLEEKMDEEIPQIKDIMSRVKGDKGDDSKAEEVAEILIRNKDFLREIKGKDSTPLEVAEFLLSVPEFLDMVRGKDAERVEAKDVASELKNDDIFIQKLKGEPGKNGRPGRRGESVSKDEVLIAVKQDIPTLGEPIRDSLELLSGEDRLDRSAIKGLEDYDEAIRFSKDGPRMIATMSGQQGIKEIRPGANITIDNSSLGYPIISATGGGGGGTPGGSVNNVQLNDGAGGFTGTNELTYDNFTGLIAVPGFTASDGLGNYAGMSIYDGGAFPYLALGGNGTVPAYLNLVSGGGLHAGSDLFVDFDVSSITDNRTVSFPDKDGTIAYLDDIPELQTNGTPNAAQNLLNLKAGTNVTLTDDGLGGVTIDSTGGGGGSYTGGTGIDITGSVVSVDFTEFDTDDITDTAANRFTTDTDITRLANTSGTNTGDQTSIVGISGTKAQFDTALSDGNFLYVGDITQYTDENAQDAVGTILTDSSEIDFTYNDGTPSITASLIAGSIDETKLDASVNASLALAGTAVQPAGLSGYWKTDGTSTPATGDWDLGNNDLSLRNTTAASSGSQQLSPEFLLEGQGWKTTATAASQSVRFKAFVRPVQGTTAPTGAYVIQSSINGGSYSDRMTLDNSGNLNLGSGGKLIFLSGTNTIGYGAPGGVGSIVYSGQHYFPNGITSMAVYGLDQLIDGDGGDISLKAGLSSAYSGIPHRGGDIYIQPGDGAGPDLTRKGNVVFRTPASGTGTTALTMDVNGTFTFAFDAIVPDEAYGSGWDGSLEVPTKNAVYDKIQSMGGGTGDVVGPGSSGNNNVALFNGTTGKLIKDSGLTLSGSNTGDQTITLTGDITGSGTGSFATTLATVNSNVGSFGSATQVGSFTVNGKGLITAASNVTVTPAVGSITGLGTGVSTFLATPSSANLLAAVTDETGTGALVFANTPTLVTPVIGAATGTSVVLSGNATAAAVIPSGSTVPTNGLYLPAANTLGWAVNSAAEMRLTSTALSPNANDGNALGTSSLAWADLFLASGAVINIASSNWIATHTSGILTVGTGDLRVTNAGTNTASVVTNGGTSTLTNKRISKRVAVTAQSATPAINTDNGDIFQITGLASNVTSFTTNLTGTPVAGDMMMVQITDSGSARTLSWGASFASTSNASLPATTVASTMIRVLFQRNNANTVWDCIAVT